VSSTGTIAARAKQHSAGRATGLRLAGREQ
jgi:hypothetical protein